MKVYLRDNLDADKRYGPLWGIAPDINDVHHIKRADAPPPESAVRIDDGVGDAKGNYAWAWYAAHNIFIYTLTYNLRVTKRSKWLFSGMTNLEDITPNLFNFSELKDASELFAGCQSLSAVNIRLPEALNISGAFMDCYTLQSVQLYCPKASCARQLFKNDFELREVRFASDAPAFYASEMMENCERMEYAQLNFKGNFEEADRLCKNCSSLKKFSFVETNETYTSATEMFMNCRSLPRFAVTGWKCTGTDIFKGTDIAFSSAPA